MTLAGGDTSNSVATGDLSVVQVSACGTGPGPILNSVRTNLVSGW